MRNPAFVKSDAWLKAGPRGLQGETQLLPTDGPVVVSALGHGYLSAVHGDTPEWSAERSAALTYPSVAHARRALRYTLLPPSAGVTRAEVAHG